MSVRVLRGASDSKGRRRRRTGRHAPKVSPEVAPCMLVATRDSDASGSFRLRQLGNTEKRGCQWPASPSPSTGANRALGIGAAQAAVQNTTSSSGTVTVAPGFEPGRKSARAGGECRVLGLASVAVLVRRNAGAWMLPLGSRVDAAPFQARAARPPLAAPRSLAGQARSGSPVDSPRRPGACPLCC